MKALIIEDEKAAVRNLQALLSEIAPDMEILALLDSITETIDWFGAHKMPDLIFLDIHLADGSAFEIFGHVDITCPIIFTTAYVNQAKPQIYTAVFYVIGNSDRIIAHGCAMERIRNRTLRLSVCVPHNHNKRKVLEISNQLSSARSPTPFSKHLIKFIIYLYKKLN